MFESSCAVLHSPPPPPRGGSCQGGPRRAPAASSVATSGLFKKAHTCGSLFAKCGCNNDDRNSNTSTLHPSPPTKRSVPLLNIIPRVQECSTISCYPTHFRKGFQKLTSSHSFFNVSYTYYNLTTFGFFLFISVLYVSKYALYFMAHLSFSTSSPSLNLLLSSFLIGAPRYFVLLGKRMICLC